MTETGNPLLYRGGLPLFDKIKPEHVIEAVREVLKRSAAKLEQLEKSLEGAWDALMAPLEALDYDMQMTWGPVNHLLGVKNTPELRQAHETVLPEVIDFSLRLNQSQAVYQALRKMKDGSAWNTLSEAQRRIIDKRLLAAAHAGIGLEGEQKKRFNEIVNEISKLSSDFSNNVLDATKAFALDLTEPVEVEGLPPSLLALAAQSYNEANGVAAGAGAAVPESGPWRITLELPSFLPFMQHARRRDLREKLYRAYIKRASEGQTDNTPLIQRLLQLKYEKARLLGHATPAEYSLTEKMADSVEEVDRLHEELRLAAWEATKRDLADLRDIAARDGFLEDIMHWDIAYWSERLREEQFQFTDEDLRPYFPLPVVLEGLFALAERLFGARVAPADGEAPVWHEDVRFFKITESNGEPVAFFYLDPYSRPQDKRGGAWMDDCRGRRRLNEHVELPVAYLVCNSTPPVASPAKGKSPTGAISGKRPALMTFREVETLFHEFGHGLQHMLTRVDHMDAAGINGVEWDAVELPSQFMENWCYHKPTLLGLTSHVETGKPMPDDLFEKLRRARTFRAGSDMLRQIRFGMLDMELHHRFDPNGRESIFDVQRRIDSKTSLLPSLPEDRFLCSFSHIFAGGYSAGYYSYKWAEVLSADAFSAFEEAGLDNPEKIAALGRRFRDTILALGGSRHPRDIFKEFRGRDPSTRALLVQNGLL